MPAQRLRFKGTGAARGHWGAEGGGKEEGVHTARQPPKQMPVTPVSHSLVRGALSLATAVFTAKLKQ